MTVLPVLRIGCGERIGLVECGQDHLLCGRCLEVRGVVLARAAHYLSEKRKHNSEKKLIQSVSLIERESYVDGLFWATLEIANLSIDDLVVWMQEHKGEKV